MFATMKARDLLPPLLLLLAAACSNKKEEAKGGGALPAGGGQADGTSPAGAGAPAAVGALSCDRVLPPSLRDKYFAGAEIKDVKKLSSDNGGCGVKLGADKNASIDVLCDDSSWQAKDASIHVLHEMGSDYKVTDLAIGKGGAVVDHPISQQVSVWDDDSNCVITLSMTPPGGVDLQALARDMVAALPPAGRKASAPASKQACKLAGSCSRCKDSKDCTGGETCITYQKGANHYSGCVDGKTCSIGEIMVYGDELCGTRNKMD
jgi:hypothetical protein